MLSLLHGVADFTLKTSPTVVILWDVTCYMLPLLHGVADFTLKTKEN